MNVRCYRKWERGRTGSAVRLTGGGDGLPGTLKSMTAEHVFSLKAAITCHFSSLPYGAIVIESDPNVIACTTSTVETVAGSVCTVSWCVCRCEHIRVHTSEDAGRLVHRNNSRDLPFDHHRACQQRRVCCLTNKKKDVSKRNGCISVGVLQSSSLLHAIPSVGGLPAAISRLLMQPEPAVGPSWWMDACSIETPLRE